MIDNILDVSNIETGSLILKREPFVVRETIEASLESFSVRAAEKGLKLTCTIDEATPRVIIGDADRLRQILASLVSNAVKFTLKGQIVVRVSATRHAVDPLRVGLLFTVRDTGIGIPKNRMERVFRSFSRVDSSATPKHGTNAVGLAVSKRLCGLMGGRMFAESDLHWGSTFSFAFEADVDESQEECHLDVPGRTEQ
jgi:signal transduction histidine kinase